MGEVVSTDGVDCGKAYNSVDTDKAREALMK